MNASTQLMRYIETAKDIEKKGLSFYKRALKKVEDPNSRGLLKLLVKEEEHHLALFKDLPKRIKFDKKPGKVKKLKTPLFKKDAYKKIHKRRTMTIDIFNTALEMEEKGIEFYTKMAGRVKNPQLKKFLKELAEFELRHFKLIKEHQNAIYDAWYWEAMEMPALNM